MNRIILIGALLIALAGTACAGILSSSDDLRYKVTVTIETPEGLRTGSAVREARTYYEKSILPEQGGRFYNITKGEAIVIDLGQRGLLFGLLGGENEARNVFTIFTDKTANGEIVLNLHPQFVRFKDLNDPKTVENIKDYKPCGLRQACLEKDHMEEFFGTGVKLKSVTAAITKEKVSFSIEEYLPWLSTIGMGNLGGGKFSGKELYERMSVWDFKKDIK